MTNQTEILRIIDANFNRLREGLRVLEEVPRMVNNHAELATTLKLLRHKVTDCALTFDAGVLLEARDSAGDVGRYGAKGREGVRESLADIVAANFKRCQEAARVLEEFSKMVNPKASELIKEIRFSLYDLEKAWGMPTPT